LAAGAAGAWWAFKHKKAVPIPHQVQAPPAGTPLQPDETTAQPKPAPSSAGEQVQPRKPKTSTTIKKPEHREQ